MCVCVAAMPPEVAVWLEPVPRVNFRTLLYLSFFLFCGVGAVMVLLYTVRDGTVRGLRGFDGFFDRLFHLIDLITDEQV